MKKIVLIALFSVSLVACVVPVFYGHYRYMKEGDIAAQLGDLHFAKKNYQKAVAQARSDYRHPEVVVVALFRYARILGNLCEYDEAEKSFDEANRLSEQLMGDGSMATYSILIEIGQFNYDIGRYNKAVQYFQRAFTIGEKHKQYEGDIKSLANESGLYADYADALIRTDDIIKGKAVGQKAQALKEKFGKDATEYTRYPTFCSPIPNPVVTSGNDSDLAIITNTVDHLATLKVFSKSGQVRLIGIDRVMGPHGYIFGFNSTVDGGLNVKVLPGMRKLTVYLLGNTPPYSRGTRDRYSYCTETVAVLFNAEKGHVYDLTYHIMGDKWFPSLIDKSSGTKVDAQLLKEVSPMRLKIPLHACNL